MKGTLQDCKKILINVLRICNKKLTNILKNSLQYDIMKLKEVNMTEIKDVLFAAVDNADYILRVALFAAIVESPLVVLVALVNYFG